MRRLTAMFLAVLAVTTALWPAGGAAQDAKERARELSAKGQALYDEGRFGDAAAKFEEAQAVFPHPVNLFNAAKAWEKAAEYAKAADTYRRYLDLYREQNGQAAPDATDVEATIVLMKDKAYQALPEVTIESDPPGADIYLDEPTRLLGQTPFTTHLPEGSHKVFLKKGGFQGFERQFEVRSRQPLRLSFALEKIKNEGGIRVTVNIRKARIYIDGKVVAVSPYVEVLPAEAGRHQVTVEKERYNQVTQAVDVQPNRITEVHASLNLTSAGFSYRGGLGIASALLGAGSLGTAFWLRSVAATKFEDTSDFRTYRTWTYVGYGVGAGLLALGTGLLVWEFTRKAVDTEDLVRDDRPQVPQFLVGGDGRSWIIGAAARF